MTGRHAALAATARERVDRDQLAVGEDLHFIDQCMHLDHPRVDPVRHAVVVAADRDHAIAAHAPLDGELGAVGERRQRLQCWPFLGKGLGNDAPGGAVHAHIGHRRQPLGELRVQVFQIPERAAQEEVLADIAKRPFHLALGLCPVGGAGPRREAIMARLRRPGAWGYA
jgi:hypothetical protein